MLEMLLANKAGANPGSWAQLSDVGGPTARTGATAAGIDDKVYTFGGIITTTQTHYNDLRCYDTNTGSWSLKKAGPVARHGHVGVAARGKFYIHAGSSSSGSLGDLWEYDPASDTWVKKADAAITRSDGAVCAVDGVLYVATGYSGGYKNDLRSYNIDTNTWGVLPSLPGVVRQSSAMAALGTKLYLFGGNVGSARYSDFWCYDTIGGVWEQLQDGPAGCYDHSMVAMNGKLYVHGGMATVGYSGETWSYDPNTAQWTALRPLLPGHVSHYAAACQGKMFIGTGQTSGGTGGVIKDFWQYTPPL